MFIVSWLHDADFLVNFISRCDKLTVTDVNSFFCFQKSSETWHYLKITLYFLTMKKTLIYCASFYFIRKSVYLMIFLLELIESGTYHFEIFLFTACCLHNPIEYDNMIRASGSFKSDYSITDLLIVYCQNAESIKIQGSYMGLELRLCFLSISIVTQRRVKV